MTKAINLFAQKINKQTHQIDLTDIHQKKIKFNADDWFETYVDELTVNFQNLNVSESDQKSKTKSNHRAILIAPPPRYINFQ